MWQVLFGNTSLISEAAKNVHNVKLIVWVNDVIFYQQANIGGYVTRAAN